MRKSVWGVLGSLAIVGAIVYVRYAQPLVQVLLAPLPNLPKPEKVAWLEQGWKADAAGWYHHADQGTRTFPLPYEWLMALGQPGLGYAPFADQNYLDRFGFIPDETSGGIGLPIGFARGGTASFADATPLTNPATGKPLSRLGLTCAACHTGRLTYHGVELRIEGAPAATNLKLFQEKLGVALLATRWLPWEFDGFANRLLGPDANQGVRGRLKQQLDMALAEFAETSKREASVADKSVDEGFGRLDALNRIGNEVFSVDLGQPANFAPETAPVHFPRIWDASWFTWVQYDGSIMQPMVRNAGEALGVSTPVVMHPGPAQFRSELNVDALSDMEAMLAGPTPPTAHTGFTGLRAPGWPTDVLPPIDVATAAKGRGLYRDICEPCHQASVWTPEFWSSAKWVQLRPGGDRVLDVERVPVDHVGTDPWEARVLSDRTVATPQDVGITETNFGKALGQLVEKVVLRAYNDHVPPLSPEERDQMNGRRPNKVEAPLAYKARPLDAIWATPPYLHNGSVPSLYELLSPVAERTKVLFLGSHEFDPVNVGIKVEHFEGASELDTSKPGNSNAGHTFSDQPGSGVVGRYLTPEERHSLVEYLKTLDRPETSSGETRWQ
jgi:hypothetical protein